jgi:hypothetical protein
MLALLCLRDGPGLDTYRTRQATAPFAFSLLDWEVRHFGERFGDLFRATRGELQATEAADVAMLKAYFQAPAAARPGLRREAETAIQRLITEELRAEGLAAPSPLAGGGLALFPPLSFTFTEPPRVLIVSPRERIAVSDYVLLRADLKPSEVALLEDGVATRGLSTLVTPIGGLATYPFMVLESGSAQSVLAAVAHEWVHAYFFFHPVGRGYAANQDVRTINETAAELAGNELGSRLAGQLGFLSEASARPPSPGQAEFNRLLRETRLEVDRLLAMGRVAEVEQYMEQRRLELNARGFGLRRLNQAYFAFHGSYAEGPAGSSPIAGQIRRLRNSSSSLGGFLRTIAQVGDARDLASLAG